MAPSIEVWRIDVRSLEAELLSLDHRLEMLPAADRARAGSIADPGEARFWRAVRVAVRLIVARHAGMEVARREVTIDGSGRPAFPGTGLEIGISHCRPIALLGLASTPVGVDIEMIRPVSIAPGRRLRIEAAADAIGDVPLPASGDARFIAAWCRIEALAKASGLGLARTLTELGLARTLTELGARGGRAAAMTRRRTQGLAILDLSAHPGFAAALAAPAPLPAVTLRRFPDRPEELTAWLGA